MFSALQLQSGTDIPVVPEHPRTIIGSKSPHIQTTLSCIPSCGHSVEQICNRLPTKNQQHRQGPIPASPRIQDGLQAHPQSYLWLGNYLSGMPCWPVCSPLSCLPERHTSPTPVNMIAEQSHSCPAASNVAIGYPFPGVYHNNPIIHSLARFTLQATVTLQIIRCQTAQPPEQAETV